MAKCYVGTYGKYNAGSLYGKWLDLADYATYQDFLTACKELHNDECEPEYMIQDWENLPDGFPTTAEWISESDFNDIKAAEQDEEKASVQIVDYSEKAFAVIGETKSIKNDLKRLGGRFNPKLSCGAGWIFSKKALDEVRKFLDCGEVSANNNQPTQKKDEALWEECKRRLLKENNNNQERTQDDLKRISNLMMCECGLILTFEKRHINVDFPFADEGPQYEFYKELCSSEKALSDYFISENLEWYDDMIKRLETRRDHYDNPLVGVIYESRIWSKDGYQSTGISNTMQMMGEYDFKSENADNRVPVFQMTENDLTKALAIIKDERAKLEKRLNSYLKRYGTKKIHTWSYWADR